MTNNASNKLEGWIDDQITEREFEFDDDSFENSSDSALYDDWIDNSNIDSYEEFNRMNKRNINENSNDEKDLDPWF